MKILITGGAGFIGSHLTSELLEQEHEVHILDNFSTGSQENIDCHHSNPRLWRHEGDILDAANFKSDSDDCAHEKQTDLCPEPTDPSCSFFRSDGKNWQRQQDDCPGDEVKHDVENDRSNEGHMRPDVELRFDSDAWPGGIWVRVR